MPSLGFTWPRLGMAASAIHWRWGPTPAPQRGCRVGGPAYKRELTLMPRGGVIFYARGAPPPLARAAALEDSLSSRGPQALGVGSARHPSAAAALGTPAWPPAP